MSWSRWFTVPDDLTGRAISWPVRVFNYVLVFLVLSLVFFLSFRFLAGTVQWGAAYQYRALFWKGWLVTIVISASALVLSALIGIISALARRSSILVLSYLARTYVELVRGTPLLVQILFFYYGVANALGLNNRYVAGVLCLSIFSGAYISEIVRAGIESVGKSQLESARAIGLTRGQTYRYVIFPQALRQMLPPLAGQFASLVKDSSLLSIIGLGELTRNAEDVNAVIYGTWACYLPLAAGYLVLTLPISLWTRRLEQRLRFET